MDITVLNSALEKIAIIDNYSSLIWTDRYFDAGDYEISSRPTQTILSALLQGTYLSIPDSDRLMMIGPMEIKTDEENGPELISKGSSLEWILSYRILYENVVLSGNLQDNIYLLLLQNALNSTDPYRNFQNLIFTESTDPLVTGLTIEQECEEGSYLYEVIADICASNGIGFKITLTEDGHFNFQLYSGVDRSSGQLTNPHVIFSPNFENLVNSDYHSSSENQKTVALVAGETGVGNVRTKILVECPEGAGSDLLRKEFFVNANDVRRNLDDGTALSDEDYEVQLFAKGIEELSKNTSITSFDGALNTHHTYKLGDDFNLGDIVEIENEFGLYSNGRISEIIFSNNENGYAVYPTFSSFSQ